MPPKRFTAGMVGVIFSERPINPSRVRHPIKGPVLERRVGGRAGRLTSIGHPVESPGRAIRDTCDGTPFRRLQCRLDWG
jgi:hypothetical protein